ncbi:MAG: carboxypeptidase regulatory-like domain-containing protein [Planctomycetes bacterium]|nr:carboxypeptidase regulatory-like domain-containing protein [Planctomycetota bacterium]
MGLLALAVLVAGLWWWWRPGTEELQPVPSAPTVPRPESTPDVVAGPDLRTAPATRSPEALVEPTPAIPPIAGDTWYQLQRELDPGQLEVLVLRAGERVVGASVQVWPPGTNWVCEPAFGSDPPLRRGSTGADGRVRFEGLPNGDYAVRAVVDEDFAAAPAKVGAGEAGGRARTVVLMLGKASVAGTVLTGDGAPRSGEAVYVTGLGPLPPRDFLARTDAAGRYRIGGLAAGRYNVQIQPPGPWSADNERMLSVAAGERARIDFGPVAPLHELRGRIVEGAGGPVYGRRELRFVHAEHNDERRAWTATDGTFAIQIPAGQWSILSPDAAERLQVATVPATGVVDVPWPGPCVVVWLHVPPDIDAASLRGGIFLDDKAPDAVIDRNGEVVLQWLGVTPGRRRLQAQNGFALVGVGHEYGIDVAEGRVRSEFRLGVELLRR